MNRIHIGEVVPVRLPLDVRSMMISTITNACGAPSHTAAAVAPPTKKQKRTSKKNKRNKRNSNKRNNRAGPSSVVTFSFGPALAGGESREAAALASLLAHVESYPAFPEITAAHHRGLLARVSIISYSVNEVHYNVVLEISMPLASESEKPFEHASLLWMPWVPHQQQPIDVPGRYHLIQMDNWCFLQARETICLDYPYYFSGQEHPKELTTPPEITALYAETNSMFDRRRPSQRLNMTYINRYRHGRHCINEHSDEVGAYGSNLDVCCFITGRASREAVFRVRTHGKRIQDRLQSLCVDPRRALSTREILRVKIPAGLYVMHGQQFQFRFSHEFPELLPRMYACIVDGISNDPQTFPDFPAVVEKSPEGADRSHIVQAQYVKDHADLVREHMAQLKRPDVSLQKELENFDEWCLTRTSYTQRCFNPQVSQQISAQEALKREGKDGGKRKRKRRKKKKKKA